MADEQGASTVAASPHKHADDDDEQSSSSLPAEGKNLPPLSRDITDASATGASSTYTDYSIIAFEDEADPKSRDAASSGSNASSSGGGSGGHHQGENFPTKLHRILSRPDLVHIVSWLDHGRAWKVLSQDAFASVVIPEYFNHNKYTSFSRQVNGWGFRRIGGSGGTRKDSSGAAYYHELFLRGMPHLVRFMRRPGPVVAPPPRKGEEEENKNGGGAAVGGGGDGGEKKKKSSRIGRRRRTAADRGNEPDFYAVGRARPLPLENPPGYRYSAGDGGGNGAVVVARAAAVSSSAACFNSALSGSSNKKKKKRNVVVKGAIDEVVSTDKNGRADDIDIDDHDDWEDFAWGSDEEEAFHDPKKTKTARADVSASGGGADFLASEIFGGNNMSDLLHQQMKLMEMQKKVMAQMLPPPPPQQANDQSLSFLAGNHPQGQASQANPAATGQMQKGIMSSYADFGAVRQSQAAVPAQATSGAFDPSPLVVPSMPLKNDGDDYDGMDISPKLVPREAPAPRRFADAASPPDDDDFDKELDELAGFLGNADDDDGAMDMEEESGLDVWKLGGDGGAAAFDAPLTADVVSASFSKTKPDALEMPQQSAQGMRTARAYPVGLLPAAAAPKYDARFDAQGNGMVHMAAAGNAPRDRMHMMATMAQKQQQQQRGAMFHSSVMM